MQAREEGLGLCQEASPMRTCLHPLVSPLPSNTGCSRPQGAWGNLELIPIICLVLFESGSHCGKTTGSSLDVPQSPAIVHTVFHSERLSPEISLHVGAQQSLWFSSQGPPGASLASSPNAFCELYRGGEFLSLGWFFFWFCFVFSVFQTERRACGGLVIHSQEICMS